MDKNQRKEVKNPRQNANLLSVLTFWWIFKLFAIGYKKELEESDLYSPLREDRSQELGKRIEKAWENELVRCKEKNDGSKPRLCKVLSKCFGKTVMLIGLSLIPLEFGIRILEPFLLAALLRYFSAGRQVWTSDIYYYAAPFCLLPLIGCLITHWYVHSLTHMGMRIRLACCSLIYRKILKLSSSALENETSSGQVINLLSNDVGRLDWCVLYIHHLWVAPLQALLIAYLLVREIGWAAVTGMLTFLFTTFFQLYMGGQISRLTFVFAEKTDYRLRLMNRIIAGIEIIKMYVWEIPYSLLVKKARREEVNVLEKRSIIEQICLSSDKYIPRLGLFVSIITYVLTGNNIDAEKVFLMTAFFNVLRNSMNISFIWCVNGISEGMASLERIDRFMMSSELPKSECNSNQVATENFPVYLKDVTAKWDRSKGNTLQGINLTVRSGSFIAIIGQIGSGKSSLLQAISRELPIKRGILETRGKISYANQQPWIFSSSIRQNILFGQPMDETRYNEVIRVCQLKRDIDSLPHGDSTIVGERGINLSGGQRARINLARALYTDSVIYLLDDPLSAVNVHVGNRIVEESIRGFLKDKTRILVTHQLQYLKHADLIVVMHDGRIRVKGTFQQLQDMDFDLMQIFKNTEESKDDSQFESEVENDIRPLVEDKKQERKASECDPIEISETRNIGMVSRKVYLSYFKASRNAFLVFLTTFLFLTSQVLGSGCDYLLAFWVNLETASWVRSKNGWMNFEWHGPLPRQGIIYLYSGLIICFVCFYAFQTFAYFSVCMRSSKNLHADMFRSITRTTTHFYNTNPAGRILNRFSKDIGAIDERIPRTMYDVLAILLMCMGTATVVVIVNLWFLIPILMLMFIIYILRAIYIPTSRAIKRMEGIARSPVFDHVSATLQGLATIRAFKAERILTSEFDNYQDLHTSSFFLCMCASRTFGIYVEFFCLVYVGLMTVAFIVFEDLAVAGDIGLVITQVLAVSIWLQWGTRQLAELESEITSVERVLEYSRLEEEPFLDTDAQKKPPDDWPNNGMVEFKDVKMKYSPKGIYVLKGISFAVMPREKVGVVGRTGAGKTSLISALFRTAYVEGEILLDGISTGTIALHDFRSKISIIPQEPMLFGGSLRRNLDPFDEYPDEVLWDALQEVELKETISDMVAGLDTQVAEEGLNFSVGQRQLLCLARALVRSNKIMVLDEATANVDSQTDYLIQKTVRRKFTDCTVFTIAHRLNTIMDSDKILVMDQGCLMEFDHPYVLLQKKGYFYNIVQETSSAMAATLFEVAKNRFYKNDVIPS